MQINWNKSYFVLFYNPRVNSKPTLLSLDCDTFSIQRLDAFKYLGVWIDETMSFDTHVNKLLNKLIPRMYFLNRLKRFIPINKFPQIFRSIVLSSYEYCIGVWGGPKSAGLSKLQNCILRNISKFFSPRALPVNEMLDFFSILHPSEFHSYYLAIFAHWFVNFSPSGIPSILTDFLELPNSERSMRSITLTVPKYQNSLYKHSVKYCSTLIWNALPISIKNTDVSNFKFLLQQNFVMNRNQIV